MGSIQYFPKTEPRIYFVHNLDLLLQIFITALTFNANIFLALSFSANIYIYFFTALTFNDEQFHLLEKMKMKETAKSLETLLASVTATLHQTTDNLADWCK